MTCFADDTSLRRLKECQRGRNISNSFAGMVAIGIITFGFGGNSPASAQKLTPPKKPVVAVRTPVAPSVKKAGVPVVAPHKQVRSGRRRVYRGRRRYSTRRRRVPTVITVFDKKGNYVEPLSNGLTFTMPAPSVQTHFGKPQKTIGSQLRYADFGVEYLKGSSKMNFVALQGNVKLNSKLGAGSTRSQVEKVFGKLNSQGDVVYKKYKLHFSHSPGGIIDAVTVAPLPGSEAL
jgi:hypothetical protein